MSCWEVRNIVCSGNLNKTIRIAEILTLFPSATHKPRKFPNICIRGLSAHTTLLLFKSGKLVTVGSRTETEALEAMHKLASKLESLPGKRKYCVSDFRVTNIVASGEFPHKIRIEQLYSAYRKNTGIFWEPTLFPGFEFRKNSLTLVAFHSGKFFVTGAKKIGDIQQIYEEFLDIAKQFYIV